MKKKSFSKASNLRCNTKSLIKDKRILKKLRHKRARQGEIIEYRKSYAWNLI